MGGDPAGENALSEAQATSKQITPPQPAPSVSGPGTFALRSALANGRPAPRVVLDLMSKYPNERDSMIALLQSTVGNSYVQEVLGSTASASATAAPAPPVAATPVSTTEYWQKNGASVLGQVTTRALSQIVFDIRGPGLKFPASERGAFIMLAIGWRLNDPDPVALSQLLETPLFELIDGVRLLDEHNASEPAVVDRIVERLGLSIRRAVDRLAIPYAKARARAVSAAEAKASAAENSGTGLEPPQPTADPNAAEPSPTSIGARTPTEHSVADAMCNGHFIEFDKSALGMMWDSTIPGEARHVALDLERGRGDWKMVRVLNGVTATPADVANSLFGSPQYERLVVGHGDRYSFVFPPGTDLAEPYQSWWDDKMAAEGASPLAKLHARGETDPVAGLDKATADQRALDSATETQKDGHGAAPVLLRLDIIQSIVDDIARAAGHLGVAKQVEPLRAHLAQRRAKCTKDPSEAEKWAQHSIAQLDLLKESKSAFDALSEQMLAMGAPGVSNADGAELVGDVTESMQAPTREVAGAFALAVADSDQLDVGREQLAIAKERMAAYPFDMTDRMLASIRRRIAATSNYATVPMKAYDQQRLAAVEQRLQSTVANLRMAVVNGDGTAPLKLKELRSQLAMLDLQSTLGSTISAINELKGELHNAESWSPNNAREDVIFGELQAAMEPWRTVADNYDKAWQAGLGADAAWIDHIRTQVEQLRKTTQLPELVNKVASFATDEAKRQRWIQIGVMIAAVLAAAVTGGVASAAVGGGMVGAIVGAGFESLSFTAITSTLQNDPTFGGFMAELTINFATFGGLRAISEGAKLVAAGRALTLSEKLGEMTLEGLWMVASVKAQELIEARIRGGGQVTAQGAATVFGEQFVISVASRAVARIASFASLVRKANKIKEVELALKEGEEDTNIANSILDKKDWKLGETFVKKDTATMRSEVAALDQVSKVAANPAEAAKHGLQLEPHELAEIEKQRIGGKREIVEREISELMRKTETEAGHVIAEPDVYAQLLEKHGEQGASIKPGTDSAGLAQATITPRLADGTMGETFVLHSRTGDDVEKILADRKLPNSKRVDDYLAKRAHERKAAIADLKKVHSPEELDALLDKTLGKDPTVAAATPAPHSSIPPHEQTEALLRANGIPEPVIKSLGLDSVKVQPNATTIQDASTAWTKLAAKDLGMSPKQSRELLRGFLLEQDGPRLASIIASGKLERVDGYERVLRQLANPQMRSTLLVVMERAEQRAGEPLVLEPLAEGKSPLKAPGPRIAPGADVDLAVHDADGDWTEVYQMKNIEKNPVTGPGQTVRPVPRRVRAAAFDAAEQLEKADGLQIQRSGKHSRKIVEIRAEAARSELDPSSWAADFKAAHKDVEVMIYPLDGEPWSIR
jgi:hypothetical protein